MSLVNRIALLQNYDKEDKRALEMANALTGNLNNIFQNAQVDVFISPRGDSFPNPKAYQLIVLSGGPHSLAVESLPLWIGETFKFLRVAHEQTLAKIVGICWGHLAIKKALGGQVGNLSGEGTCVGVKPVYLNETGKEAFAKWKKTAANGGLLSIM
ncbi:hypothetical protein FOXG_22495 [Fusarium oxysporum f. sp. lycopersici 4287]|uniref:Glutamine amidotransferase domain-containing protein n=1 Tax=Fusarium oxysporum f. sp. lycopersici (strain 4287 / CBS 123668 / FGSC 9935 / NRRL 34936) TaxID=426428 RepID=A0A0J9W9G6_FUSO4|nr:hypothetical protein FOXG_22495 [Fusarium oxysporum f. sp. lycopersici 4287]EWZ77482.1 hypothetical protein FOWG_18111 [Fusarium oxysporum f. sp. lycopersici MN25]KNB19250.1 hypothetical protein FOXG_22495 [Fusarium oxysporum f. sp. lycopersici 4287]